MVSADSLDGGSDETPDDDEAPRGIFIGLSAGAGTAGSALSSGLGALDVFFNPGAARAREELEQQHERVIPTPSPGDRMLEDGVIVIDLPEPGPDDQPGDSTMRRSSKGSSTP